MVHNQCLSLLPSKYNIKCYPKTALLIQNKTMQNIVASFLSWKFTFQMQFSVIQFRAKTMTVTIIYCIFRSICNVQVYSRLQLSHSFYIIVVTKMDRHSKCTCRKTQCPIVECIHDSNNIDIKRFSFLSSIYTRFVIVKLK